MWRCVIWRLWEQLEFENVSVVTQGPVFGAVGAEVKYGKSTIVVTVRTFSDMW